MSQTRAAGYCVEVRLTRAVGILSDIATGVQPDFKFRRRSGMENKEVFEIVRQHLMAQGAKSFRGARCAYRGADGLMCAVGVLIPDDQYQESMDAKISQLPDIQKSCPALRTVNYGLLAELQWLHDCVWPVDWAERLEKLEKSYGF